MFSNLKNHQDVKESGQLTKATNYSTHEFDLIVEKYIALVNQLKKDIAELKEELNYHKKLHGELSDSLDEFITIQKASEIITQHLEIEKIARSFLELCERVIHFDTGNIFLKHHHDWQAVLPNAREDFEKLLLNMEEEGIIHWIWQQDQAIVIPLEEFIFYEQLHYQNANLVIIPLLLNQKGIGVALLLSNKEQSNFSLRDLELLNLLGMQTAIAINYTQLYKTLEKAHLELKNSQNQLIQAIKLATVGELAGGIAHEINNPLQIILGKIQIAMISGQTEDVLKVVEMQAMRISTIVRGLLSLAREQKFKGNEYIEINPIIKNTLNLVKGQIEKRGIQIQLNLTENLPIIVGNSVYLQQILLNFFLNAKKRMSNGGKLVITSSNTDENSIQIEITDTGMPFSSNEIEYILKPFTETTSEPTNYNETNLGLVVSVQMIREIGGNVDISSSQSEGTKILITIPKQTQQGTNHGSQEAANA